MVGTWCKVIDGLVTTGNGKVIDEGDRVKVSVGNAQVPVEIKDISNAFMMRLWDENNHRQPSSEVGNKPIQPTRRSSSS